MHLLTIFPLLNFANTLGTSVIAPIKENASEAISVLPNAPKVILAIPSVNMIGKNIAIVVNVDASIAFVTVLVPQ